MIVQQQNQPPLFEVKKALAHVSLLRTAWDC